MGAKNSSFFANKQFKLGIIFIAITSTLIFIKPIVGKIGILLEHRANKIKRGMRPKRVILIRHGLSQMFDTESVSTQTPDNSIPLHEKGIAQCKLSGEELRKIIPENETIRFLVSPFKRTVETFEHISKFFKPSQYTFTEEPRIREQEIGNYQQTSEFKKSNKEREVVGKFYFRYFCGESGADVYDRASLFLDSLFREIDDVDNSKVDNIVLITHSLFMRLFLMRYYSWPVEYFNLLKSPGFGKIWVLEKNKDGRYDLKTEMNYYDKE
jgi:broad specificity phosphatase PhoE